jgi:hypothetical protein
VNKSEWRKLIKQSPLSREEGEKLLWMTCRWYRAITHSTTETDISGPQFPYTIPPNFRILLTGNSVIFLPFLYSGNKWPFRGPNFFALIFFFSWSNQGSYPECPALYICTRLFHAQLIPLLCIWAHYTPPKHQ